MIRAVLTFLMILLTLPAAAQEFRALARVIPEGSALRDAPGGGADLVLALSQAVPFRVFTLDDPARVVVDFREVAWDGMTSDFDTAGPVEAVQTGGALQAGWSRMVLRLALPLKVTEAAMETDPTDGTAIVHLRMEPVSQEVFAGTAGAPPGVTTLVTPGLVAPGPEHSQIPRQDGGQRLIVVLDPGHGGVDPGAQRGGHDEADLVLIFARELREMLVRTGRFEVILTRESDSFVPLPTRVSIARAARADLFISLHADALAEGRATGATVYTLSDTASDAASAALAEHHDRADLLAGIDLTGSDDVVAGVLMDLARLDTDPRSEALADALVAGISAGGGGMHSHPHSEAGFSVLKAADIPSVLVELGFMSEPSDLANLLDPEWRAAVQAGIRDAILGWAAGDAAAAALRRQ
ncbi:N-acetylmuramoyl-L-alanine amidase [Rhodophyticola sp. CCM32]|uniref:N-acetylmuramoyl-L-alanine amidase n=1 Tax=Rhodophyticola sp. CCM32 TaxID=2916397 RepID=UPI00107FC889|nr:N-acetylmuramoyl-L-alanine amidase [Rhodophyticola sp. CCM32]QBY00996.1 N-acetylmuramoyl-L-alanine amidase [Rhodophyticola sp. CCM32]